MRPIPRIVLALVASCLALFASSCVGGPATKPHQLTSGRTIRVISVGRMHFTEAPPALVLSYQTDLEVDQAEALQEEVAEIWRGFQRDAEQAKLSSAVIMANEVPDGFLIKTNRSRSFVFARNPDGTWLQEADSRK